MDLKHFSPAQHQRMTIQPSKGQNAPVLTAPKPSKYRNVKVLIDGEHFDSQHEADIWLLLTSRERAGDISDLRRQVDFPIYVPIMRDGTWIDGAMIELCIYRADFVFHDKSGRQIVMDAKGQKKRICPYPLKAKALALSYGITIEEV